MYKAYVYVFTITCSDEEIAERTRWRIMGLEQLDNTWREILQFHSEQVAVSRCCWSISICRPVFKLREYQKSQSIKTQLFNDVAEYEEEERMPQI